MLKQGAHRMMNLHNIIIQVAFLYAPFVHGKIEQVTPTLYRGLDPKTKVIYKLHDQGIKTIISLRTNPERKKQRLCEELGMNWIQIWGTNTLQVRGSQVGGTGPPPVPMVVAPVVRRSLQHVFVHRAEQLSNPRRCFYVSHQPLGNI